MNTENQTAQTENAVSAPEGYEVISVPVAFRKKKIEDLQALVDLGLKSSEYILLKRWEDEEGSTQEQEVKAVEDATHFFRKEQKLEVVAPTLETLANDEKGEFILNQLLQSFYAGEVRSSYDNAGSVFLPEDFQLTPEAIAKSLAPSTRGAGKKSATIKKKVLREMEKELANWLNARGRSKAAINAQVSALSQQYSLAALSGFSQEVIEKIAENFAAFTDDLSETLADSWENEISILFESLEEAVKQEEITADDL